MKIVHACHIFSRQNVTNWHAEIFVSHYTQQMSGYEFPNPKLKTAWGYMPTKFHDTQCIVWVIDNGNVPYKTQNLLFGGATPHKWMRLFGTYIPFKFHELRCYRVIPWKLCPTTLCSRGASVEREQILHINSTQISWYFHFFVFQ